MAKKRRFKKGVLGKLFVFLLFVGLIVGGIIFGLDYISKPKVSEYTKTLNYFNRDINIKLYMNNESSAEEVFGEIEKIYKNYSELTDRTKAYEGINNVYTINNTKNISALEINKELYNIIDSSINYYNKTNGVFNINDGNLIDIIKNDNTANLSGAYGLDIKDIVLYNDFKIFTGYVNLNLDYIDLGYASLVVKHYLDNVDINQYKIETNNFILVAKNMDNERYNLEFDNIKLKIKDKAISIVDTNSVVVDSKNKQIPNNMKKVIVISDDPILSSVLSKTLYLVTVEQGQEYMKSYNDVDVIWVQNDDQVVKTDKIKNYE